MVMAYQVVEIVNKRWKAQVETPLSISTLYYGLGSSPPGSNVEFARLQVLVNRHPDDELMGAGGTTAASIDGRVIAEYFAPWSNEADPTEAESAAQSRIGADIAPEFDGIEADGIQYGRVTWRRSGAAGSLSYVIEIPFETCET